MERMDWRAHSIQVASQDEKRLISLALESYKVEKAAFPFVSHLESAGSPVFLLLPDV